MYYSQNNCHFHFQTVSKLHIILRCLPNRVNSYSINAILIMLYFAILTTRICCITTWKQPEIEAKKLIVNESAIPHKENHGPEPFISFEINKKRNSHKHMADITEHDSNKKSKSNDIKRSRVNFLIRWNTVCIDNLLRNFKHTVFIKFWRRHFVCLLYIQNQRRKIRFGLNIQRKIRWGYEHIESKKIFWNCRSR